MHIRKGEIIAVMEDQQYIQLQQDYLIAKAKLVAAFVLGFLVLSGTSALVVKNVLAEDAPLEPESLTPQEKPR